MNTKTSSYALISILILYWLSIANFVQADVCTAIATGNYAACYAQRTQCSFSMSTYSCVDGAPASCVAYESDKIGCNTTSFHPTFNCSFSTASNTCLPAPVVCSTVLTQPSCNQQVTCAWNATKGVCFAFALTQCAQQLSVVPCSAIGCYWDSFLNLCYVSLSEVNTQYACGTWTSYPVGSGACVAHGCSLLSDGITCVTSGTGGGNITGVTTQFLGSFVNPNVLPNSFNFQVQVWLPNNLPINPSINYFITIGGGVAGYGAPGFITPGPCNDLLSFNYSVPPPTYLSISDPVGLQNYLNNFIQTNHTFNFPKTNTTFGLPLYQIMGYLNIGNNSIDTSVSLDPTGQWIIHLIQFNMNNIVAQCSAFGASQVYTTTDTYYNLPIAVISRDNNNNFAQITSTFFVHVSQTGSILSVSSSSQYQPILFETELTSLTSTCPSGQAMLNNVYMLEVQNVYVGGVFAGPRNISDIVWTSPAIGNALNNCYGEQVVSMTRLTCLNSVCYTQITTQTLCRPLTTDGNAFNNCSYANAADRIAAMGGNFPFPTALNQVHSFYVNIYTCPTIANATNQWVNCTLANMSPQGYPDLMPVNLQINIYPQTVLNVNFDVYAGLLPNPYITDLTQIETLSQGPNFVSTTTDLFNTNLEWNGIFTFVAGVLDPTLRTVANFSLTPSVLFQIVPLDINGRQIQNGQILYIEQVFPYMMFVPSQMVQYCHTTCSQAPATVNQTGYDSFAIPVITLRTLLPANGYAVSVSYYLSLPRAANAIALGYQPTMRTMGVHRNHTNRRTTESFNTNPSKFKMTLQTAQPVKPRKLTNAKYTAPAATHAVVSDTHLTDDSAVMYMKAIEESDRTYNTNRKLLDAPADGQLSGNYTFSFLINDLTNPNPPVVIANTSYDINGVNGTIIQGCQVAARLLVGYTSGLTSQNITALVDYVIQQAPYAVAYTLGIDINQVINVQASTNPNVNGLYGNRPVKLLTKRDYARFNTLNASTSNSVASTNLRTKRRILSVDDLFKTSKEAAAHAKKKALVTQNAAIGPPIYVSFVLIPAPNGTTTACQLAENLLSPASIAALEADLLEVNLLLDLTYSTSTATVFVFATTWYMEGGPLTITVSNGPTTAPPYTGPPPPPPPIERERDGMTDSEIGAWIGFVVFVFIVFMICILWQCQTDPAPFGIGQTPQGLVPTGQIVYAPLSVQTSMPHQLNVPKSAHSPNHASHHNSPRHTSHSPSHRAHHTDSDHHPHHSHHHLAVSPSHSHHSSSSIKRGRTKRTKK